MTTAMYPVTGMTCEHCAVAVAQELKAIDGVTDVRVDVVAGGNSRVTVTSQAALSSSAVIRALEAAGEYHLAGM